MLNLFLCLVLGQDLSLPPQVKAKTSDFIVIQAQTENKNVKFVMLDEGLNILNRSLVADPKTFIAVASKNGKYKLLCYTAKGDMPSDPVFCEIIVGDNNPDPEPVKPDQLKEIVKSVYGAQPDPEGKDAMLAGFKDVLKNIESAESVKDFDGLVKKYVSPKLKKDQLTALRGVLSDHLAANLGNKASANLDKAKAKQVLVQIIDVLSSL